jgi:hypothetical protein
MSTIQLSFVDWLIIAIYDRFIDRPETPPVLFALPPDLSRDIFFFDALRSSR